MGLNGCFSDDSEKIYVCQGLKIIIEEKKKEEKELLIQSDMTGGMEKEMGRWYKGRAEKVKNERIIIENFISKNCSIPKI